MEAPTDPQRRFERIKTDLAIIKWMLACNVLAVFALLHLVGHMGRY
jgi:hypothetical protein